MRLIDADAYVEYLHKVLIEAIDEDATTEGIALVKSIVRGFESDLRDENITPTIKPERKKGKWIVCTESIEETFHTGCRCSACNYWKPMGIWNYCPNCGADMREDT